MFFKSVPDIKFILKTQCDENSCYYYYNLMIFWTAKCLEIIGRKVMGE